MRKSLIALLILVLASVGLLVGATAAVNGQDKAVEITEELLFGDPAAAEGLRLGVNLANALVLGLLGAPGFGLLVMMDWALAI